MGAGALGAQAIDIPRSWDRRVTAEASMLSGASLKQAAWLCGCATILSGFNFTSHATVVPRERKRETPRLPLSPSAA
jgi:hypothetical protein